MTQEPRGGRIIKELKKNINVRIITLLLINFHCYFCKNKIWNASELFL